MIRASPEFKTSETRSPPFVGLSEYVSRPCRQSLVIALVDYTKEELRQHKNQLRRLGKPVGRNGSSYSFVAKSLGVTERAVQAYYYGDYQPSNINVDELLQLAFDIIPTRTVDLLEEDMETHRLWFESVAFNLRSGDFVNNRIKTEVPT